MQAVLKETIYEWIATRFFKMCILGFDKVSCSPFLKKYSWLHMCPIPCSAFLHTSWVKNVIVKIFCVISLIICEPGIWFQCRLTALVATVDMCTLIHASHSWRWITQFVNNLKCICKTNERRKCDLSATKEFIEPNRNLRSRSPIMKLNINWWLILRLGDTNFVICLKINHSRVEFKYSF